VYCGGDFVQIEKDDYICQYHKEIIKITNNLIEQYKEDKNLGTALITIKLLAEYALKQGQKMENRLYLYREAIESLGFRRDKRLKRKEPKCEAI
jgi:hypothetical protein